MRQEKSDTDINTRKSWSCIDLLLWCSPTLGFISRYFQHLGMPTLVNYLSGNFTTLRSGESPRSLDKKAEGVNDRNGLLVLALFPG